MSPRDPQEIFFHCRRLGVSLEIGPILSIYGRKDENALNLSPVQM